MLMKRGRDNGQFLSRRFVLSEREGTLKYFTKYDVSSSSDHLHSLSSLWALLGPAGPYWALLGLLTSPCSLYRRTHT